ncbi:MAG: hypothetical protein Q4P22_06715 [Eubacteriales bacterium]|nr:hypothetical protein [Eubacteriales bacterium]
MGDIKIELNEAGIRELLKSEEMQSILNEHADNALGRLGNGYEKETRIGSRRAKVMILATSARTFYKHMETNEVLKSLRGI